MELEKSQVKSTAPKVDGQEVKLPQKGMKQTRINFAKKTVMPTFVKKNAEINAIKTEKQSSGVIDLTSKGGPIKIISDLAQHKKDKQLKQSKKQVSNNKEQIKKNATSSLTKKSIFIEDDSDNEEVPLSVIKKQLSSGTSPLKKREEKTVKIISASEKEKECTVNDILKKIDKDGVKVLKVQKVDNKDNTDKRDILSNNKIIPTSSNSSIMLTSACFKPGGQAVPLKLPVNVSKIPIQITNKLTFSNTQKQIISPLQTVASPQIVPAPAKSVVIAIDMDPETWKKLSPQEQAKIITDKKEAARKHLLTLTAPTSLKILSPVRPIIPVGKPVVTKLSAQPRLPTTVATAGGTVSVSQMTQMLNQQHFMPLERKDDLELVGLKNLPIAKQVKMPLGLANKMFGDIAMIVVFVNTFKKFLSPEDQQNMTAEKLMDGLSTDGGAANVILNILLLFLKVVLTSDDYKVKGLKIELADLPLTEYSASYLTEQFLKSQIEKKKRQKKALEMAQAAALAVEKAELGNELNESIDEENLFLQSDDEEWESHKKKKKKSELTCNTEEHQLKTISAQLESNEFHQMNTCDQLTVLTYMLHIILESEDFAFHYDELEDEKLKLYRELESCRKERMKLKREREEMQRLATIDNFMKSAQTKEVVDTKDVKEVDSQKPTEISAFSGMTQRQIDAIKAEGEKEAQKKKELEMEKMEAVQREENKISMELKKMIAICRSALRLQPLGMDRYCRTYWMFSKEIPGIFVCSGGVATCSLNLAPPPVTKVERWAQYTTKEEIDSLISSLTSRGVREFHLRNALKTNYNNVISALNKTPVIEGESETAEKYSATTASVNALKEDLIESANRIVHGSLGDLRVDLEEWTSNVKTINDISKLKEYMLQIQKSILPKYYTSPFDAGSNDISTEWCKTVDKAKTLSFLHTLFGILENSVQWDMSAENMRCNACRKKTMKNGHLVRCDECENGYHSLCLKPPLLTIPQGVWTCPKCLALAAKKAQEIEQQFLDALNSDHEDLCHVCETDGHMILCDTCPLSYHFECHNPPLRRVPRGAWSCYECRNLPSRKRRRKNDSTECSENDESADDNSCDNDKAFTKTSKRKFKKKDNEILNNKKTKKHNSSKNAVNSKHKNSTSKNSRSSISKRKGRSAKSSGEEWDNEEEADDEEESWSNTSPILGNKRPRYVKDCTNRELKKSSQNSPTDVELKSNKQKSAPNKSHTNTRKVAYSARSQRRAGRSSRGNNYELKACREILMGLRRHEFAWPFLSPVDLDKAPQYLELISKPMDFTLILKKLDMLEYEDVLHFIEDVKTVFDNSKSYNSNSSEIGQAGINLARVFDMLLKEHLPEIYTTFNKEEQT